MFDNQAGAFSVSRRPRKRGPCLPGVYPLSAVRQAVACYVLTFEAFWDFLGV